MSDPDLLGLRWFLGNKKMMVKISGTKRMSGGRGGMMMSGNPVDRGLLGNLRRLSTWVMKEMNVER